MACECTYNMPEVQGSGPEQGPYLTIQGNIYTKQKM
jgi:hypothetical protein